MFDMYALMCITLLTLSTGVAIVNKVSDKHQDQVRGAMLTTLQKSALRRLLAAGGESSYGLRASLRTLYALEARGLVHSRHGFGSVMSPRTRIKWFATSAGRAAIAVYPE